MITKPRAVVMLTFEGADLGPVPLAAARQLPHGRQELIAVVRGVRKSQESGEVQLAGIRRCRCIAASESSPKAGS